MLCKTEWSRKLWSWSHKSNLFWLIFYQLLPTTSVGHKYGQQMRIQMLNLGCKGLSSMQIATDWKPSHETEDKVIILEQAVLLFSSITFCLKRFHQIFWLALQINKLESTKKEKRIIKCTITCVNRVKAWTTIYCNCFWGLKATIERLKRVNVSTTLSGIIGILKCWTGIVQGYWQMFMLTCSATEKFFGMFHW